ncbi:unnamed protein product, partial [Didymodactylos carnosus]
PDENSGRRPAILLSEQQQEHIRYTFHRILADRIYPTTEKILDYMLADDDDFPVHSPTTLLRWMKKLGLVYKRTSKVIVPLDSPSFMAARARYFRALDQLKSKGSKIFWHDETWCNKNEEKVFVWTDGTTGKGRLRNSDGKGKRLAISALLSNSGFHLPSVDIFECDENHSMDSNHFVAWIDRASHTIRKELGKDATVTLILDNATWHNRLTEETMPPKRSWKKQLIINWLDKHDLPFTDNMTKAELLEVAFDNLPSKRYVVDEVAAKNDVQILRLPIKHCMLNPIELAWSGLKNFVRKNNINFRLSDVRHLAMQWISSLTAGDSGAYIDHTLKIEETFKKSDRFTEQIEEDLMDEDDDDVNSEEEGVLD